VDNRAPQYFSFLSWPVINSELGARVRCAHSAFPIISLPPPTAISSLISLSTPFQVLVHFPIVCSSLGYFCFGRKGPHLRLAFEPCAPDSTSCLERSRSRVRRRGDFLSPPLKSFFFFFFERLRYIASINVSCSPPDPLSLRVYALTRCPVMSFSPGAFPHLFLPPSPVFFLLPWPLLVGSDAVAFSECGLPRFLSSLGGFFPLYPSWIFSVEHPRRLVCAFTRIHFRRVFLEPSAASRIFFSWEVLVGGDLTHLFL